MPSAPGYVDLTKVNAYDPDKARALLKEAGVSNLELTITLPPPPYARQGGEVIASMLDKVGIKAKLQNVEWAQWLSGTYGNKNYDMTIISHVEPFDLGTSHARATTGTTSPPGSTPCSTNTSRPPTPPSAARSWPTSSAWWLTTPCMATFTSRSG